MKRPLAIIALVMAIFLTASTAPPLAAQAAPATSTDRIPEFEVATVKINKSGGTQTQLGGAGGRISVTNMQLRGIIQSAYRIRANQLVNVPGWVNTMRVDIVAKADPIFSFQQLQTMLQPLLVERFKLAFHHEMRDLDVFMLVLAKKDGTLGPRLKQSATDCAVLGAAPRNTLTPPQPGERPACGIIPSGPGHIVAAGFNMNAFTAVLSLTTGGRQVIDQTGLTGGYDIDLTYTPDALSASALASRPDPGAPPPIGGVDPNGPSLYTAVQEQLGLKLEPKKLPMDVMVIDHIEPPEEN